MSTATNDRALLELAAKAARGAGLNVRLADESGYEGDDKIHAVVLDDAGERIIAIWNPLTDDGDALRLAHAAGIWMKFEPWFEIGHYRLPHSIACTGRLDMADARSLIVEVAAKVAQLPPLPVQEPVRMSDITTIGRAML